LKKPTCEGARAKKILEKKDCARKYGPAHHCKLQVQSKQKTHKREE